MTGRCLATTLYERQRREAIRRKKVERWKRLRERAAFAEPKGKQGSVMYRPLYHGGCQGCTQSIEVCLGCRYMKANWGLPDLNPRHAELRAEAVRADAQQLEKKPEAQPAADETEVE